MPNLTRHDFLKLATHGLLTAGSLLGMGALLRFLGHPTDTPRPSSYDLGPAVNYPLGSRTLLADVPAVLLHEQTGFSALSLVCPHLGCTAEHSTDGFTCPCHGSHFTANGHVSHGPAESHLATLRVELNGDKNLILYLH